MASYEQMSPRDNILAEVEVIKEQTNRAAYRLLSKNLFDIKNLFLAALSAISRYLIRRCSAT